MQVKRSALAVRAAVRLGHALRLNHGEPLLLVIEFVKPLFEQRSLAQWEARNLLHQPLESLGVHGYPPKLVRYALYASEAKIPHLTVT